MEVPTPQPVEKNVFKRLFKADPKASQKTPKTPNEDVKKTSTKTVPCKGRPVTSRLFSGSGSKAVGRGAATTVTSTKPPGPKMSKAIVNTTTPANVTKATFKTSLRIKVGDKTPPSVRLARTKLQSSKYWLSLVDVAEKAGKHEVALGLFQLAIDSGAQPLSDILRHQATYKKRYHLEGAKCKGPGDLPSEAQVETAVTPNFEDTGSEICPGAEASVKNLYQEEYAQIPFGHKEPDNKQPEDSSEVFSCGGGSVEKESDTETEKKEPESEKKEPEPETEKKEPEPETEKKEPETEKKEPGTEKKRTGTPLPPRDTPRRACAIRAALRLEESARKQSRRKETGVENMDVNTLMKEVVSGVLSGSDNVVEDPETEIFSKVTPLGKGLQSADANVPKPARKAFVASPASGNMVHPKSKAASKFDGNFEVVKEPIHVNKEKPTNRIARGGMKNVKVEVRAKVDSANSEQQLETPPTNKTSEAKAAVTPGTTELRRSARLLKLTT